MSALQTTSVGWLPSDGKTVDAGTEGQRRAREWSPAEKTRGTDMRATLNHSEERQTESS